MNIVFYPAISQRDKDGNPLQPFEISIKELVNEFFESEYCQLPMRYERSFIGMISNNFKGNGTTYDPITEEQWKHIYEEIEQHSKQ